MAEPKTYIAHKHNFTIHRGVGYVQEHRGGELVTVRVPQEPIEFTNGTLKTDDPEIQEAVEGLSCFGEDLEDGDVALASSKEDLEEAAEEAPSSELEARLQNAETSDEVAAILEEEGYPVTPAEATAPGDLSEDGSEDDTEEEASYDEPEGEEATASEAPETVIGGVSNKDDALKALDSIEGVDFGVNTSNTVDEIAAAAAKEGYSFTDWP